MSRFKLSLFCHLGANYRWLYFISQMSLILHSVQETDDGKILLIIILYEQNIVTQVNIIVPNLEGERCIFEQFALLVS